VRRVGDNTREAWGVKRGSQREREGVDVSRPESGAGAENIRADFGSFEFVERQKDIGLRWD